MKLTKEQLEKFKDIYKEQTGAEINDETALILAQKLLGLIKLIYKPIKKSDEQKVRQMKFNF